MSPNTVLLSISNTCSFCIKGSLIAKIPSAVFFGVKINSLGERPTLLNSSTKGVPSDCNNV